MEDMNKKEQELSTEGKDTSREDTLILAEERGKEAVIEETQEEIQREEAAKEKEGFGSWMKKHRKKVMALGLAAVLLGGALAVGGMHVFARHGGKKMGGHDKGFHREQSFEAPRGSRGMKGKMPGAKPGVEQKRSPEKFQGREGFNQLLGEEELKKVVETELKVAPDEVKYKSVMLLRNPNFIKDPSVATEAEETTPSTDAKSKVLESASDPMLYEVQVEVKDKTHELLIGAVTGKVYSSSEQVED